METIFTSFKGLFTEGNISQIEIPKIQRSYAQGRRDARTTRTRNRFLKAIYDKISQDEIITLDFVYGEIDKDNKLFIPLDGQQRLTTLFLLYWYAAKKENINISEYAFLHNFTYKTRYSARNFCEKLIDSPLNIEDEISTQIEDQTWFPLDWKRDATIDSMLCMLDAIQKQFAELENLWERLDKVKFYFKSLEDMGLTDDIYIKMNSRGKPLTDFEHFKAEFEKNLKSIDESTAKRIARKIDGDWTNLLWQYRDEGEVVDDYFLRYFRFICDIICYKNNGSPRITDEFELLKIYFEGEQAKENVLLLESYFDCWLQESQNNGMRQSIDIDDFFNNFISEDNEHKVGKIISEYAPNMFKDCTTDYADLRGNGNRKFNLNKIILLYTFIAYRVYNNQHPTDPIAEDDFRRRLRIVSNLVKNSSDEISDSEQRQGGNRLPAILKQVDSIVINGIVDENITINGESKINFNLFQIKEEVEKLDYTSKNRDKAEHLFELEDHYLLNGQISIVGLREELFDKFQQLFNCDWDKVDCALLSIGDYSQRDNWWRIQLGSKASRQPCGRTAWKKLLHHSSAEGYENTQSILQTLLANYEITDKVLDSICLDFIKECEQQGLYPWRYYYCKYKEFRVGRFGKYTQIKERPYEMVSLYQASKESSNSKQLFLSVISNNLSKDDCGRAIWIDDKYLICENDRFALYDENDEEIGFRNINQDENGIDTQNRIKIGKKWYNKLVSE